VLAVTSVGTVLMLNCSRREILNHDLLYPRHCLY